MSEWGRFGQIGRGYLLPSPLPSMNGASRLMRFAVAMTINVPTINPAKLSFVDKYLSGLQNLNASGLDRFF